MQAPETSPRSAWTTRSRCSTNSSAPPSSTPTPPRCAAWNAVSPSGCRSSPATGARSRAARARSASGWRASSSSCATSRRGWMDVPHDGRRARGGSRAGPARRGRPRRDSPLPQDDDERFIVGLVLTYYRRHPQRARTRLLDLLGEVLMPAGRRTATGQARAAKSAARRRRLALAALADRRRAAEAQTLRPSLRARPDRRTALAHLITALLSFDQVAALHPCRGGEAPRSTLPAHMTRFTVPSPSVGRIPCGNPRPFARRGQAGRVLLVMRPRGLAPPRR